MKITKKMFKSFEGLEELKKIQKEGYCNSFPCSKCPLDNSNIKCNITWDKTECSDIIDLSAYRARDPEIVNRMDKLIKIFTKENINSILAKLAPNRKLKYNDYVVYNNRAFRIKGVLKASAGLYNPILLSGYDANCVEYGPCVVGRKAIEKEYNLWVDPSEIFTINDTVILKESNVEYKIVAIGKPDLPILLNDYTGFRLPINDIEKGDILCNAPEAYEERYSKWVSSNNIKHK